MIPNIKDKEFKADNQVDINNQRPSILIGKKDSIEGKTPKRNYDTGTITTYKKYQQEYYRFSYYGVDKRKHHIHLGNIHNPKAIKMIEMIREKQSNKTPLKEIVKFITSNKV